VSEGVSFHVPSTLGRPGFESVVAHGQPGEGWYHGAFCVPGDELTGTRPGRAAVGPPTHDGCEGGLALVSVARP